MFVNSLETINSRLEGISLNYTKMQPKSDRPVGPKEVPQLHLTPSTISAPKTPGSAQPRNSPWLLKPQHDIPPTPPPQTDAQPFEFIPQRIG